jgi:hypothetical protein
MLVTLLKHGNCASYVSRLWDILLLLRYTIRQRHNHTDTVLFTVSVRNDQRQQQSVKLKAVCGPDDAGAPCFTLMLPEED